MPSPRNRKRPAPRTPRTASRAGIPQTRPAFSSREVEEVPEVEAEEPKPKRRRSKSKSKEAPSDE